VPNILNDRHIASYKDSEIQIISKIPTMAYETHIACVLMSERAGVSVEQVIPQIDVPQFQFLQ
jgi:hypothetical protein